jgi:glycerate 2-kinase
MGCERSGAADGGRARRDLERIYASAVAAVEPGRLVAQALEGLTPGAEDAPAMIGAASGIFAVAVGKAALAMAAEIDRRCGAKLCAAIAVVPKRASLDKRDASGGEGPSPENRRATLAHRVEVHYACHPLPDESSVAAAGAVLATISQARLGDLVIVAVSGGASAMLTSPAGAISLEDKIAITSALMRAGASIHELNIVRKHLSVLKGGQLLRATNGARVLGLILSDVPGNDLATIGSALTAADATTFGDAIGVLKRRRLWGRAPESMRDHLERGAAGEISETVKSGDLVLGRVTNVLVGDNETALAAAQNAALAMGYAVDRWRELRGEANDLARGLAAHLCAIERDNVCVLAGGEPVVTVRGGGRGGRAQQCALALALEFDGIGGTRRARTIAALVAGTDGIDGPTDAAGAFAYADTVRRAREAGVDPVAALQRNDSYGVFGALGDLFITGPTGTNVSDIFIGLVNY